MFPLAGASGRDPLHPGLARVCKCSWQQDVDMGQLLTVPACGHWAEPLVLAPGPEETHMGAPAGAAGPQSTDRMRTQPKGERGWTG